jgi:hypothetical protein
MEIKLMVEQTITWGQIGEVVLYIAGVVVVFTTMRNTIAGMAKQIEKMQRELEKLSLIVTQMAVADVRLTKLETEVFELRHGDGWVQGRRGIDREYGGDK